MWPRATNSTEVLGALRIGEAEGGDAIDRTRQTRDGPIVNRRDRIRIGASGDDRAEVDRHPHLLAVVLNREEAGLCARRASLIEKHMRRGCNEIIGERKLTGAMRLPAFDEPGARETGAKLGRAKLLLSREFLDAAAAVFAEDDNGHDLIGRHLRQFMRQERNGGRLNGHTKKEDANGRGAHSTLW